MHLWYTLGVRRTENTVQMRINDALKERAQKAAARLGLSVSALFRLALVEKLERMERQAPPGPADQD